MTRTLVTILGRAVRRDGDAGYNEATYRFRDDGTKDRRSAFFGLALARHLQPDEIVILGTAGSMWSVLVENLAGEGDDEEARIKLMEAESAEVVDDQQLEAVAPLMERAVGAVVRPTLIPHARDEGEQHGILKAVAEAVAQDSELHFDLTHGFRHVGMVGFLASFMLETLHRLTVHGLWYGAHEMSKGGITPVLRLDGLMRVRQWLEALAKFDATGDYGVFASLLKKDRVPKRKADCLEAAAFLERTLNVRDAARKLKTFLPVLDGQLAGASGLFQPHLKLRLRWAKATTLSEQQYLLARQYLGRGDYVRAAVLGREACGSRLCEENGVSTNEYYSEDRQETLKELANALPRHRRDAYGAMTAMRNALAHGSRPRRSDIEAALRDPQKLGRELRRALGDFF